MSEVIVRHVFLTADAGLPLLLPERYLTLERSGCF